MRPLNTALICFILTLAVTAPVCSDPLTITPYISVRQEYSDNILFTQSNEESDSITTISPGLEIEQNTERLDARIRGQFDKILYWQFDELDSLDYDFDGSVSYRVTERLGTRASARYAKDSRRDRDAETTGLLVTGDRKLAALDLGTDYMLSEIQSMDVSMGFQRSETERIGANEDNDTFDVTLSFNRNLSEHFENTVGILNLNYLHYTADNDATSVSNIVTYQDNTSDIFQFSTGFSHDITELYNVFLLAGASYTQTTEKAGTRIGSVDFPGPEYKDDTIGGVFNTGVNYTDIYNTVNLTLSQDIRGGTGTSGAVQRTSLSGSYSRRMTAELSFNLNASVYKNKNERRTAADTDTLTFNISPGFRYKLARDLFLSGVYRFTSVEDRTADTTSERSLVYLLLKKEFEL